MVYRRDFVSRVTRLANARSERSSAGLVAASDFVRGHKLLIRPHQPDNVLDGPRPQIKKCAESAAAKPQGETWLVSTIAILPNQISPLVKFLAKTSTPTSSA